MRDLTAPDRALSAWNRQSKMICAADKLVNLRGEGKALTGAR